MIVLVNFQRLLFLHLKGIFLELYDHRLLINAFNESEPDVVEYLVGRTNYPLGDFFVLHLELGGIYTIIRIMVFSRS